MMYKFANINKDKMNKFMDIRFLREVVNKAILKAKSLGITENQPLIIKKLQAEQDYKDIYEQILGEFYNSNLVKFDDNWYGILSVNNKKSELTVVPLCENNLEEIYIDFTVNKEKPRENYSQFIKENTNHEALDDYKNKILRKRDELLNTIFVCSDHIMKDGEKYLITSHCINRWEERINNKKTKIKLNTHEIIVKQLNSVFNKAKKVYTSETLNTNFYLDKKTMIFFAVSDENVILTLWKNSYGFSDSHINDLTTMLQLEYIVKYKEKASKEQKKINSENEQLYKNYIELEDNITDIKKEIAKLQKKVNDLSATKGRINNQIKDNKNNIMEISQQLQYEENLVFKHHSMIN